MERAATARDGWYIWPPFAGYLGACVTAMLVMATYLVARSVGDAPPGLGSAFLGVVTFGLPLTLVLASPGFLMLRYSLHLARRSDSVSFAMAGAANAYGLASLLLGADTLELYLRYPPDPAFAVAGAVGGVACWWVERKLATCPSAVEAPKDA